MTCSKCGASAVDVTAIGSTERVMLCPECGHEDREPLPLPYGDRFATPDEIKKLFGGEGEEWKE